MDSAGETGPDGRLHHAVERVHLRSQGGDVTPVRREVKRRDLVERAGEQDTPIGGWLQSAHEDIVRAKAPVLRPSELVDQLEPLTAPGVVSGKAKPLENYAVHFVAEQQLGKSELRFGGKKRHGFV